MQRVIRILVLVLILGLGGLWGSAWFGREAGSRWAIPLCARSRR
ncbi:hypothetical protein ACFQU7_20045 [Pseudoroseomonas wenyumeiae]